MWLALGRNLQINTVFSLVHQSKRKKKKREREKSMGWIVPSLAQHIGLSFYSGVIHKIFFFLMDS